MSEGSPHSPEQDLHSLVADVEQMTAGTLELMEIAEGEISAAMERDPENAARYNASFMLLAPTSTLVSDLLYSRHCQEMLERVAKGLDTRPATDAEILGALSEATHVAPIGRTMSLAYARMVRSVFPDQADMVDELVASVGRERYEGDVDEFLATCRRKLTNKDRVRKENEE